MEQIEIMDRVQITGTNPGEEHFLNKVGDVIMIADGKRYLVSFGDGKGAAFTIEQLKKVVQR